MDKYVRLVMPNAEQSDGANQATFSQCGRISTAELHAACRSTHWIGEDKLSELRQKFPFLDTSKWRRKEKKRLRKNWRHIKKYHPDYSDPKFAFGIGHDNESRMSPEEVESKEASYKSFNIMLHMAYRLKDRLICDIYMKCRRMFYDKSFYFNSRDDVPAELEKRVKLDLSMNEAPQIIAHKYNISPTTIDTIRRRPRVTAKRFKWTETAINHLRRSVEIVHNVDDLNELPARDINWQRVKTEMELFDYHLNEEQCYNKWIRLNPSSIIRGRQGDNDNEQGLQ